MKCEDCLLQQQKRLETGCIVPTMQQKKYKPIVPTKEIYTTQLPLLIKQGELKTNI